MTQKKSPVSVTTTAGRRIFGDLWITTSQSTKGGRKSKRSLKVRKGKDWLS